MSLQVHQCRVIGSPEFRRVRLRCQGFSHVAGACAVLGPADGGKEPEVVNEVKQQRIRVVANHCGVSFGQKACLCTLYLYLYLYLSIYIYIYSKRVQRLAIETLSPEESYPLRPNPAGLRDSD